MEIEFRDKKLGEMVTDQRSLFRVLGQRRATILLNRLDDIEAAIRIDDLRALPGSFHPLVGKRKGEWACSLDQPYRLVFTIEGNKIIIQEIVDYHGV